MRKSDVITHYCNNKYCGYVDNIIYVANQSGKLTLFNSNNDVLDKQKFKTISDVVTYNNLMYVITEKGIVIYDMSLLKIIKIIDNHKITGYEFVVANSNYLCVYYRYDRTSIQKINIDTNEFIPLINTKQNMKYEDDHNDWSDCEYIFSAIDDDKLYIVRHTFYVCLEHDNEVMQGIKYNLLVINFAMNDEFTIEKTIKLNVSLICYGCYHTIKYHNKKLYLYDDEIHSFIIYNICDDTTVTIKDNLTCNAYMSPYRLVVNCDKYLCYINAFLTVIVILNLETNTIDSIEKIFGDKHVEIFDAIDTHKIKELYEFPSINKMLLEKIDNDSVVNKSCDKLPTDNNIQVNMLANSTRIAFFYHDTLFCVKALILDLVTKTHYTKIIIEESAECVSHCPVFGCVGPVPNPNIGTKELRLLGSNEKSLFFIIGDDANDYSRTDSNMTIDNFVPKIVPLTTNN